MADSTNQTHSEDTQSKVSGGFTTDVGELGKNYWIEGPTLSFLRY